MKAVLALVTLCGLVLTVESACDVTACTVPSLASYSCSNLQTLISCLNTEKGGCTSSQTVLETAIDSSVTTYTAARNTLGCTGTMVTVSVATLIISLFAAFMKF